MMSKRLGWVALACSALLAATAPASSECMRGPFKVRLPAGRLDARLQDISHKTGCALDVDVSEIGSKRAPALRGSYTDAQMLNLSLMNSGMAATWQENHWIIRPQGD